MPLTEIQVKRIESWKKQAKKRRCSIASLARELKIVLNTLKSILRRPVRRRCHREMWRKTLKKTAKETKKFGRKRRVYNVSKVFRMLPKGLSYRTSCRLLSGDRAGRKKKPERLVCNNFEFSWSQESWSSYISSQRYWS